METYNGLVRKITTGLTLSTYVALFSMGLVGCARTGYVDLTSRIPGQETRCVLSKTNKGYMEKASVNGNVFLKTIVSEDSEGRIHHYGLADLDGDGHFEKRYTAKELDQMVDYPQNFDMPPEWVFK